MLITKLPIDIIELEADNFHLFIDCIIGRKKARFLIDTGASKTVMDKGEVQKYVKLKEIVLHEAHSIGLGAQNMQTEITFIKTIKLNQVKLTNTEVAVLDLAHVNQTYQMLKIPQIAGVLGSDLLLKLNAVINYPKKQLKIKG